MAIDLEKYRPERIETYEAVIPVTGILPNDWREWPPHLRDALEQAVEAQNIIRMVEEGSTDRLAVAWTSCHRDPGGWYVKIVLQPAQFVEPWRGPSLEERL